MQVGFSGTAPDFSKAMFPKFGAISEQMDEAQKSIAAALGEQPPDTFARLDVEAQIESLGLDIQQEALKGLLARERVESRNYLREKLEHIWQLPPDQAGQIAKRIAALYHKSRQKNGAGIPELLLREKGAQARDASFDLDRLVRLLTAYNEVQDEMENAYLQFDFEEKLSDITLSDGLAEQLQMEDKLDSVWNRNYFSPLLGYLLGESLVELVPLSHQDAKQVSELLKSEDIPEVPDEVYGFVLGRAADPLDPEVLDKIVERFPVLQEGIRLSNIRPD